ncbi:unnamed protein product [Cuscuta epithymum]|uniref:DUF1985 domain-containing protein n=1 Tax=Cuscuta epithymum TaxID=186058 RepID=A0AAV0EDZ9_9ASTE|nr:unnamed protein product [Cuscuta epithymum]
MEDNDDFTTPPPSSTPFLRSSVKVPSTQMVPKHMYKRLVKKSIVYRPIKNRKVNTYSRLFDSVSLVKQKLEPHQVQLFRKTAFGPFLDARKMCCSGLLIHYLLGNLVEVENVANPFHLYFEIQDRVVHFSVLDFTTILGLNYHDTVPTIEQESSYRGSFWLKYFPTNSRVTRSDIKLLYQSLVKGMETDEDIIRLSLIYVLSHSFLSADPKIALNSSYLNLIDDIDAFNSYPWGRVIWSDMVSCFKNGANCLKLNEAHYNVYGCVVALQVWAFESFPALREVGLALLVDPDAFPRVLRWTSAKKNPNTLNCSIFSNPNFVFQPITPSTIELNHDNVHQSGILVDSNPPVSPKPTSKLTPCSTSEKKQRRKKSNVSVGAKKQSTRTNNCRGEGGCVDMADHLPRSEFVAKIAVFNDELNSLRSLISELQAKVKVQDEVILMLKQRLHDNSSGQFTSPLRTNSVPQQAQDGSSGHHENGVHKNAAPDNLMYEKDNPAPHGVETVPLATNYPSNASDEELDVSMTQILNVAFDLYDPKDTNLSASKDINNDVSQPHTSTSFLNQVSTLPYSIF